MYVLKRGIKKEPRRHQALPDQIRFGYRACHFLAGVLLMQPRSRLLVTARPDGPRSILAGSV